MDEMTFQAKVCCMETERIPGSPPVHFLGLADKADRPVNYVAVQQSAEYDEQDLAMGMDAEYLQGSFYAGDGYGLIDCFSLHGNVLRLCFRADRAPEVGYRALVVELDPDCMDEDSLLAFLTDKLRLVPCDERE